ncbi:hypothetical protein AMS68_007527 [Peltaster fructicola]|uniref:PXA domain-containing protein n=1 Tax=Peltaster fructicola TaxID=286661 RepID=A0A6H0Y5Z1_9PEZI|nr:hypothetical protein AMS68_007527 [Peltaster fructicola]
MILTRSYVYAAVVLGAVSWVTTATYLPSVRWLPLGFILGVTTTLCASVYLILVTSRDISRDEPPTGRTGIAQLAFTSSDSAWQQEKDTLASRAEYRRPTIFPQVAKFSKALDGLLDLLLQEFITSWYRGISPRPLFQHEIDRAIRSAVLTFVARAAGKDLVIEGISRLLPIITGHLSDFYNAERVVRGKKLDYTVTEGDELDTAIAARYRNGKLHHVAALEHIDTSTVQQEHIRGLVARLLPLVLPANMTTSEVVTIMAREIVACAVLAPLLVLFEEPDTWNQLIITVAGPMLQDRKTVRRVRAALDQHAPTSPKTIRTSPLPRLRPYDNERQFEKFIRAIRQITTLSDARRCRSDLLSQTRKDSALDGQDPVYMRRLETGQRLLEQKIASMTTSKPSLTLPAAGGSDKKPEASLQDVLNDAAGLSYFMEYMDRLKLVQLVQFWLVVSAFRNPLEGDLDEPSAEAITGAERMDIAQMYEGYLLKPELRTPEIALAATKQYLKAGKTASSQQYINARRAVLQTQTAVQNRMRKEHFGSFRNSDLYYKWLAIDRNTAIPPSRSTASPPASPTHAPRSSSATRRPQLTGGSKESELRRAVLSSADLKGFKASDDAQDGTRRSLDSVNIRPSLFGDDDHMSDSISSLQSLQSDTDASEAQAEAKAVNAMQLALDNIVGEDDTSDKMPDMSDSRTPLERASSGRRLDSSRPNLSSLGLVVAPSSGTLVDDLFASEAPKSAGDEHGDSESAGMSDDDAVEEAAPGDLGLAEAIGALNSDVERLNGQKHILDSLKAKAELTDNVAELRILKKSEQSLLREIRRKEMQKQQWTVQESDNSLYGRAQITIKSVGVGHESDGKEYALYVIEVRRSAGENMAAATWAVTRRYSQFHDLHKRLRARFPVVRSIDFPRRQALFTLQKDFLERRRITLEQYLRSLLLVPAICRSRELRAFLSQSSITPTGAGGTSAQADARDFVSRIYNSVSDGMEELLGNIPVLDSLSLAGQNLISAAASHGPGASAALDALDPATHDPATAAEAEAELNAYETKEDEPFVKPICDLFLETFELSKGNSWLRGRTVVIVLHQLLGGTIERKVREGADSALEDDSLVGYINMLKQIMWPDGKARAPSVPRTVAEKTRARKEAALLLDSLLPDLAGSVVGSRRHVRQAERLLLC